MRQEQQKRKKRKRNGPTRQDGSHCNPSTWESKAGGLGIHGQLGPSSKNTRPSQPLLYSQIHMTRKGDTEPHTWKCIYQVQRILHWPESTYYKEHIQVVCILVNLCNIRVGDTSVGGGRGIQLSYSAAVTLLWHADRRSPTLAFLPLACPLTALPHISFSKHR